MEKSMCHPSILPINQGFDCSGGSYSLSLSLLLVLYPFLEELKNVGLGIGACLTYSRARSLDHITFGCAYGARFRFQNFV